MSEEIEIPDPVPGVYHGLRDSAYRGAGGLSSTLLRQYMKAPAKAGAALSGSLPEQKASDVFTTGILCHAMVLEPETVDSRFAVMPEGLTRQTKAGKEAYTRLQDGLEPDGLVVKHDMMQTAIGVRDGVLSHDRARQYFACGDPEVSVFANDPVTGVLLCCRCDWLCRYPSIIVDLKTCMSADGDVFGREALKYGYHIQAVHYLETCRLAGVDVDDFLFVAVEKEPPFLCQVFRLSDLLKEWTTDCWREAVNGFAGCLASGDWPGYGTDVSDIELPRWMV